MLGMAGEQQLLDHVQREQRGHSVVGEALPHFGEGEVGESARVAEEGRRDAMASRALRRVALAQRGSSSGCARRFGSAAARSKAALRSRRLRLSVAGTNPGETSCAIITSCLPPPSLPRRARARRADRGLQGADRRLLGVRAARNPTFASPLGITTMTTSWTTSALPRRTGGRRRRRRYLKRLEAIPEPACRPPTDQQGDP